MQPPRAAVGMVLAVATAWQTAFASAETPDRKSDALIARGGDACQAIWREARASRTDAQRFLFPAAAARDCLASFAIASEAQRSHASAVSEFAALHPFLSQLKRSRPPLFPSSVDLLHQLDRIGNDRRFASELDFHTALYSLLNSLNDAHVNYDPACFTGKIAFYQPFVLALDPEGELFVSRPLFANDHSFDNFWNASLNGLPAAAYTGYTVSKINDINAVEYMQTFADKYVGKTKSASSRFNRALESYQWAGDSFKLLNGTFAVQDRLQPGLQEDMTYTLVDNSDPADKGFTVVVPWAASAGSLNATVTLFSSASKYYAEHCTVNSTGSATVLSITPEEEERDAKQMLRRVWTKPFQLDTATLSTKIGTVHPGQLSIIYKGANHAFFMLSDGSTGVWVVSTFAPANDTEFGVDLTYGLVALEIAGAKRVIVDVTNNGGGDITLGCAAAYFLSPWKSRSCYHYDIRLPNVTAQILKAAHAESKRNATFDAKIFNITGYGRDEGSFEAMMDPHELIDGARLIRRGGEYARYSAIFTLDHECKRAIDIVTNSSALPQLKRGWDVKNLVVVSNGFCGSTCSNFVRTLRDKRGIKTFTYGGPTGAPFQPTAFEGGLVVTYDELSLSLATDIPNAPHVDRLAFPIRGRIPFFEIYPDADPKGQGAPAEWVEQVSEFHVDGVQPTLPESVWEGVRRQWVGRKDKGGLFKQD